MKLLDWLEKRLSPYAIPNITLLLIVGQAVIYAVSMPQLMAGQNAPLLDNTALVPSKVMDGEVWRVFTYLLHPFRTNPLFVLFAWYLFYLWGSALESIWGTFRFNLFLLVGFLASVGVAFIYPDLDLPITNGYLYGSVFLAFARFYPDFVIHLFFILPIKIKWLALLAWLLYAVNFVTGSPIEQLLVVAAVANYLLFFWRDHFDNLRDHRRRLKFATKVARTKAIVHECAVCGRSSEQEPRTAFRYCSKCSGQRCYCPDHIRDHEHVVDEADSSE